MRIFLIGFMGSGKTHWGKELASQCSIPFFDLDERIVLAEGKTISEIFAESGEEYFRIKEREMLEQLIEENESLVLSSGGGTPCFFNNIELMKKEGTVVWLNTNIEVLADRLIKEKQKRPLLRNLADDDLRGYIVKKLNERRMYYQQADLTIDNECDLSSSQLIQTILHA